MNSLEKNLKQKVKEYGPLDFPGGVIQAFRKGQKIADLSYGRIWPVYDLASLTKIVFTTSRLMQFHAEGRFKIEDPVNKYLPWYPHSRFKVKNLLNHTAGNIDWWPFYKSIDLKLLPQDRFVQLQRLIRSRPIKNVRQSKYSDIDFFLLGALIERVSDRPLEANWLDLKEQAFAKSELHFNPSSEKTKRKKSDYAPTEVCSWRKRKLQGEVHDENAWSIGGVAPHAGLFGRPADLSDWGLQLRKAFLTNRGFVPQKTVKKFTSASLPISQGAWGLGFMKPSKNSTAGQYFSSQSFGHTGFTGISLWFDPVKDLLVVLLSNRVHPTRDNRDFITLRPQIHNWIVEHLQEKAL